MASLGKLSIVNMSLFGTQDSELTKWILQDSLCFVNTFVNLFCQVNTQTPADLYKNSKLSVEILFPISSVAQEVC